MKLVDVYSTTLGKAVLYAHLQARLLEPDTNISHTRMPTFEEHEIFFHSRPYAGWYFIEENQGDLRGVCYITHNNELGIYINRRHRGKGFAKRALQMLMEMHPAPKYLANINPQNDGSSALFNRMGFNLIQHTYALEKP